MRILLINQHFPPDVAPTGYLLKELAEDLTIAGMEVLVLTGFPSYVDRSSAANPSKAEPHCGKVKIHRVRCAIVNRRSLFWRILNAVSFILRMFWRVLWLPRPDIAFIMSSPPLIYLLAIPLKYLRRTRVIHNAQDVYPDVAIALGRAKQQRRLYLQCLTLLERLSRWIYTKMDAIVVIDQQMRQHFLRKGISDAKLTIIENWIDGNKLTPVPHEANHFRREQMLTDKFVLLYSGNFGLAHDDTAIKGAMLQLRNHPDIVWLFIGGGALRSDLAQFVVTHHLQNVRLLPYQPTTEIMYTYGAADVSLVSMRDEMVGLLLPMKFYTIFASGRPTIAICPRECEIVNRLCESGCGIQVDVGDSVKLETVVLALYHDPNRRKQMGETARRLFLARYERRIATNKYITLFQKAGARD